MFKLGQCAQENWRRLRGFYLAKVITGVKFKDGIELTNDNQVVPSWHTPADSPG